MVDVYADATGDEIVHELDRRETVTQNIVFVVDELATSPAGRHLVQLPVRPNGSTGWVDAADVSITSHDFRIEVALSDFELRLYKAGEVLVEAPIGVGQQDRPTPPGTYYITELLRPTDAPNGPYGSYAYGLSGFSEVLFEFGGGPGQLGLHGTNQPEAIGTEVSSGCIRVRNEVIEDFVEGIGLPLGVPVEISA